MTFALHIKNWHEYHALDTGQSVDDVLDSIVTPLHFSVKNAELQAQSVTHYCPKYANVPFQRAH